MLVPLFVITAASASEDIHINLDAKDSSIFKVDSFNTDILGVMIGSSSSNSKEILGSDGYNIARSTTDRFHGHAHSKSDVDRREYTYSTDSFLANEFYFKKTLDITDTVDVVYSPPSLGGGAVSIVRTISFSNSESMPRIDELKKSLRQKYGDENQTLYGFCWTFSEKTRIKTTWCPAGIESDALGARKNGVFVAISAKFVDLDVVISLKYESYASDLLYEKDRIEGIAADIIDSNKRDVDKSIPKL
jgi:hypothetical protein